MVPWTHLSTNPKWHINWFSHFCTTQGRESLYFTTDRPFPLKIAPSHEGSEPHLICGSLGPPESSIQMASQSVHLFLYSPRHSVPLPTLYNGSPFPLKVAASHGRSGPLSNTRFLGPIRAHKSNTRFLGPIRAHKPNGNWIGSAVFAGLITVTDRLTDHTARLVTIGCIYVQRGGSRLRQGGNCPPNLGLAPQIFQYIGAKRSVLWLSKYAKMRFRPGSNAPDPAGIAHDAPPDLLVVLGWSTPPHTPPHWNSARLQRLAPQFSRLQRSLYRRFLS